MTKILIDEATVKLALEALEGLKSIPGGRHKLHELNAIHRKHDRAITALREALAEQPAQQCKWPTCQSEEAQQALAEQIKRELVCEQPAQQEPVPWSQALEGVWAEPDDTTPQPAQRTWVGLTPEEIMAIGREMGLKCRLGGSPNIDFDYAEAIEAKLRSKNEERN